MRLARESVLLIVICAVDLVVTLALIGANTASEGNPLMAFYLRYGVGTFVMMKLTLVILPIFIAEWSMQYRPRFVRFMLRAAIAAYVGAYLLLFVVVNTPLMHVDSHKLPSTHARKTMGAR